MRMPKSNIAVFDGTNLSAVLPVGDLWMLETSRAIRELQRFQAMSAKDIAKMSERCARLAEKPANLRPQKPEYGTIGHTAIVKIEDIMTKRPHSMMDMMGGTSTVMVRQQLRHAVLKNGDIKNVWLNMDSPGGDQDGAFDLAEDVARLSQVKPIYGYVDGSMMSACLLVGSQCTKVFSTRASHSGSLGAYTEIVDHTGEDTKAGRKVYVVKAGDQKAIGQGGPVTERQIAIVQSRINAIHELFVRAVMSGRGMDQKQVARVSDASIYLGQDAVKVGLVDGVMNLDEFQQMLEDGGEAPKGKKVYQMGNGKQQVPSWLRQGDDDDEDTTLLAQVAQPNLKPRHYQMLSQLAAAGIKTTDDLTETLQMAQTGHTALMSMRRRVTALSVVALGAAMAETVKEAINMADITRLQSMSNDFIQSGVRQGLLTETGGVPPRMTAPAQVMQVPGGGYGPPEDQRPYGQQPQVQAQQQPQQPTYVQVAQPLFSANAADEDPRAMIGQQPMQQQQRPDPVEEARRVLLATPNLGNEYSF